VGIVLNVVCGVAKVSMSQVIKGVNPFLIAQTACLLLMVFVPQIVIWPYRYFLGLPFRW
jgi:TRAP-type C4-dicarboxylate transport system permease large subunit